MTSGGNVLGKDGVRVSITRGGTSEPIEIIAVSGGCNHPLRRDCGQIGQNMDRTDGLTRTKSAHGVAGLFPSTPPVRGN